MHSFAPLQLYEFYLLSIHLWFIVWKIAEFVESRMSTDAMLKDENASLASESNRLKGQLSLVVGECNCHSREESSLGNL